MSRFDKGFSIVELVVAMCVMTVVMAAVFLVLNPSGSTFTTQAEAADMQQRLRVATDSLQRDLAMAGAGPMLWAGSGALNGFFSPVLPHKADRAGTLGTDAISLTFVRANAGQATIQNPMPARSGNVTLNTATACPAAGALCGFTVGATVCLYDESGAHDLFTVTGAGVSTLALRHDTPDSSHVYPSGSPIVEVTSYSYFLRLDPSTGVTQLARSEGDDGSDIPLVDHVVDLHFEYFGDPEAPSVQIVPPPASSRVTTYGPSPPAFDAPPTAYAAGENCVFVNLGGTYGPRLSTLTADAGSLARLDQAILTDGPWCPDTSHPRRFDADLFRVREIAVTVRVESASAAFRGPTGPWFLNAGTSRLARQWLPDLVSRLRVAPVNLSLKAWRRDEE